jgi:hypothetical protein
MTALKLHNEAKTAAKVNRAGGAMKKRELRRKKKMQEGKNCAGGNED